MQRFVSCSLSLSLSLALSIPVFLSLMPLFLSHILPLTCLLSIIIIFVVGFVLLIYSFIYCMRAKHIFVNLQLLQRWYCGFDECLKEETDNDNTNKIQACAMWILQWHRENQYDRELTFISGYTAIYIWILTQKWLIPWIESRLLIVNSQITSR